MKEYGKVQDNIFKCAQCDFIMVEDLTLTFFKYDKVTINILDKDGTLNKNYTPNGMYFSCQRCGEIKFISFEEVMLYKQQLIINYTLNKRIMCSLHDTKRNEAALDPDAGMSYCGICEGPFESSGFCQNEWIASCAVRKDKLNN